MLQIVTVMFVTIAMAMDVVHRLDLPGKLRSAGRCGSAINILPGPHPRGAAEPVCLLIILLLLFATPAGSLKFWLNAPRSSHSLVHDDQ